MIRKALFVLGLKGFYMCVCGWVLKDERDGGYIPPPPLPDIFHCLIFFSRFASYTPFHRNVSSPFCCIFPAFALKFSSTLPLITPSYWRKHSQSMRNGTCSQFNEQIKLTWGREEISSRRSGEEDLLILLSVSRG